MKIRINKFFSDSGVCSRRAADKLISQKKVFVNKKPAVLGQKIDASKDVVEVNGEIITQSIDEFVYYALNKPVGVVSTAKDEEGRKTVLDLIPKEPRVYPVGRLDRNSEGLIVLTNDGELTNELTRPSNEHEKEYVVKARIMNQAMPAGRQESRIKNEEPEIALTIEKRFTKGLSVEGKIMKAKTTKATIIHNSKFIILNTVLVTGYNRQIRKMCAKMGLEIIKLKRIRIGKLDLKQLDINTGEFKKITRGDIL